MSNLNIDYCDLALAGVRKLQPYQPGKPIDELQRELGLTQIIKLASNENPFGPSANVKQGIINSIDELSRYPDGNGFNLKQALAVKHDVAAQQVTLGNGSNDILELVTRAFVGERDEVIFSQHAFAVYPIVTQAVGAKAVVIPARDWGHDLTVMLAAINENTKLIFIANPNNPTGTWLGEQAICDFLDNVPKNILVVLDEAYFDYARHAAMQAEDYPDGATLLTRYANLLVTRTFSKAYGLAGLRIGYGLSNTMIADVLNRVRQPFNVNLLAQVAARIALDDTIHINYSVEMNARGMQQITTACAELDLNYIPSVANFLCIDMGRPAQDIYTGLLHQGVIVRPVANYEMPNHIRVTIGTQAENQQFLSALKNVLNTI